MKRIKIFEDIEKANQVVPPQTSKLLKIGERRICLVNFQGDFYAVDDRCPHMGDSLSNGTVNYLGEVICPLHEYRYNLKNGEECSNKCNSVKTYKIEISGQGVHILI